MVDIPLLSFNFTRPADGLPIFSGWLYNLKSIVFDGYESWRGCIEVKSRQDPTPWGTSLGFKDVQPVRGLGRMSMILWVICHTFYHREALSDADKDLFLRSGFIKSGAARNSHRKISDRYFGMIPEIRPKKSQNI